MLDRSDDGHPPRKPKLCPTIFRAYDIRGHYNRDFDALGVAAIMLGLRKLVETDAALKTRCAGFANQVAIARDTRPSSDEINETLKHALAQLGFPVIDLGVAPTPALYHYTAMHQPLIAIMVTGSHNPLEVNGLKILVAGRPLTRQEIEKVGRLARDLAHSPPSLEAVDTKTQSLTHRACYIASLLKHVHLKEAALGGLRVLWYTGNGATRPVLQDMLTRLPGFHVLDQAGKRAPGGLKTDPSAPEVQQEIRALIKQVEADIAFAFDGDGDRVHVVLKDGYSLGNDRLLMLMGLALLAQDPQIEMLADIKTSACAVDFLRHRGAKIQYVPTGHAAIKQRIKDDDVGFAIETSGHVFFADRYYGFDDGIYAALRLLELVGNHDNGMASFSAQLAQLPQEACLEEKKFPVAQNRKFTLMQEIQQQLLNAHLDINTLDGVRLESEKGWYVLRASNTEEAVVLRYGIYDEANIVDFKRRLSETLSAHGLNF